MVIGRKGYFQFLEIALVVLLMTTFFFVFFPRAEISYQKFQDNTNLEKTGYGTLKSLDAEGIFSTYISATTMSASNFTALKLYIKAGLPATVGSRIEYAVNPATCYSEDGAVVGCGLNLTASKNLEVIRADYTYSKRPVPITIHLFLWRKL